MPNIGFKHSSESKAKIKEASKLLHKNKNFGFQKGNNLAKQNKGKLLGIKFSESRKKKMKESNSRYWKGKTHTDEYKEKMSRSLSGNKNPRWLGGVSFLPYSLDWTETLKKSIRERDHYVCQICNQNGFVVHHIDYNKENCNPLNLITLCRSCHTKTNTRRDSWKSFFKNKI